MSDFEFTKEDMQACWSGHQLTYFLEILNGVYAIETAREDLKSLIGSEFDERGGKQ